MDLTTVADDLVVFHDGVTVHRFEGLQPSTTHELLGHEVTTLERPAGELLCRIATVNDIHFGEDECGRIDNNPEGPIQRSDPGDEPYPDTMNRAAAAEIAAMSPDAVVVKGDITADGRPEEFAAFEACYRPLFGDRLHVVRGNHDAYRGQHQYSGNRWIAMSGIAVALLDTVIPHQTTGNLTAEQFEWLHDHAADADRNETPVLVMGHHQQWIAGSDNDHRSEGYFGLHPDASDALAEVVRQHTSLIAYTAGHTHRHRVRYMPCGVPTIEVGCVKDFPGTWAEYRVYEGGIQQVVHRISGEAALRWSDRCRVLYRDFGIDYQTYAMGRLEERCMNIPLRNALKPAQAPAQAPAQHRSPISG